MMGTSSTKTSRVKTLPSPSQATVRLVISDKNWLESAAVEQLKKTAELPGMCCGVGMPDLHPGKGQPIGAAFITQNQIYPHLVGSDIGCGMGLWKLDITRRQVKLDKWEKRLVDLDDLLPRDIVESCLAHAGLSTNDMDLNVENLKLGTIGGGNHFAEFQQVHEIFDDQALSELALDKNSVVFLAHSGSRGIGQKILRCHVDQYGGQSLTDLSGLADTARSDQCNAMTKYLALHDYAVRWGRLNRDIIAERFCERIGVKKNRLLDIAHNTVTELDQQSVQALNLPVMSKQKSGSPPDNRYWIHRKGASPTDEGVVMIPGSRGSLSYLVRPRVDRQDSLAAGGFSLAHGAGRKWKRSESRGRLEKRYKVKDLEVTGLGSRVICKQRDLLYEEAPQAYKNITTVVDDLEQAGMIDLVASFKPLITYKTRRK